MSGQEVVPGLDQGGSREVTVRTHFEHGTHKICSAGLVDRLNVRRERKRSPGKVKDLPV